MPPLWQVPMPQKMITVQEEAFWCELDVEMGEGAGAGMFSPDHPARRGGPVDSIGASGRAGPGRLALFTS